LTLLIPPLCDRIDGTQDPSRQRALVVGDKWVRVKNFHVATLQALPELVAAAGLDHPPL
jgi:glutamate synthase domain-containing protein 2